MHVMCDGPGVGRFELIITVTVRLHYGYITVTGPGVGLFELIFTTKNPQGETNNKPLARPQPAAAQS